MRTDYTAPIVLKFTYYGAIIKTALTSNSFTLKVKLFEVSAVLFINLLPNSISFDMNNFESLIFNEIPAGMNE